MDGIITYYFVQSLESEQTKKPTKNKKNEKDKVLNESPKRDNLCPQCGQQLPWCVCHLNDYYLNDYQ